MSLSGIVTEIERYSIHDGPGIRTFIFLKGCPIRCKWCCNPEAIAPHIEMGYFKDKCLHSGRCVKACPYGAITFHQEIGVSTDWNICQKKCYGVTEIFPCTQNCYSGARRNIGIRMTVGEILKEVEKDRQIYDRSGGGVTLSGGEVSSQPEFASSLLREFKHQWFNTAIETNGVGRTSFYHQNANNLDFVFLDVKSMSKLKHKDWTKVANTLVLQNAIILSELSLKYGFTLVIRTPVIPGFNDTNEDIEAVAKFIYTKLPGAAGLELLPYHKLGRGKYQTLGQEYEIQELEPPSMQRMKDLDGLVESLGIRTFHF